MSGGLIQPDPASGPDAIVNALSLRRFVIYGGVLLVLGAIDLVWFIAYAEPSLTQLLQAAVASPDAQTERLRIWARLGGHAAAMLSITYFMVVQAKRITTRKEMVDNATMMIVLVGALLMASRLVMQNLDPNLGVMGIIPITALHITACLILPWSAKESSIPFIPLLLVWALVYLMVEDSNATDVLNRLAMVIISPIVLAPGAMIASWRQRRTAEDAERISLGEQVRSIGGELSRARIVHDAMFPRPFDDGYIEFDYEYLPIHEIGGDYVHTHVCPETRCVSLTLLDVAGHGLAAALTVNRLFGELERIRAENPGAEPAEVMALLNRYIHLTMSRHSMFATGACFLLDPRNGRLQWVNAGHPPTLLRRMDGRVFDLKGTTMLLGAQDDREFDTNQQELQLNPGDVVIAYTDGAYEARDLEGARFGLDRMRHTARFSPPPRSWTKFIATAVAKHHQGHADDDVLIATLTLHSLFIPQPSVANAKDAAESGGPPVTPEKTAPAS